MPRKALDGGVLIALAIGEASSRELSADIRSGTVKAFCSELGLTEMLYILCRKKGWTEALAKRDQLVGSRLVSVEPSLVVMEEAAREKCRRALALQDCFTIALARSLRCEAVFARRESELSSEQRKEPFDVPIHYLD